MKSRLSIVLAISLISSISFGQTGKNLVLVPAQPRQGETVRFEYNSAGTVLGNVTDFDAVAYVNDGQVRAEAVALHLNAGKWTGEITTNDSTRAVAIVFRKDELIDNNKEQGYSTMMYTDGQPVKGAKIALAELNSGAASTRMQLNVAGATSIALYQEEFQQHPELISKSLKSYTFLLVKADKQTAPDKVQPYLKTIVDNPNKEEKDYETLSTVYQRLGNKEKADAINADVLKQYPFGTAAKTKALGAFFSENDLTKKQALLNQLLKDFPSKTEQDKKDVDQYYAVLASTAGGNKNWPEFKRICGLVHDKSILAGAYNNAAWTLVGEGMEGTPTNLDLAEDISAKSLEYIKSPESVKGRPLLFTEKEWADNLDFAYGQYCDTYALVLWKLGREKDALKYQEQAVKKMKMGDGESNERYIVYKQKVEGTDAVRNEIEDFIKEGKSSPKMSDILKTAYLQGGHTDAEYASYMENLRKAYLEKLREEITKKMISQSAPSFALRDLSGNSVSLDDLKGKVVVLDFWATWCGPCKASFPAMQKTVEKYKNDPDVKFVFVDSWESKKAEEMEKNAGDFIAKNKYDFHVLLDTSDKAIGSYAVDGIPTKFVIDRQSNIRFKAIGYDGNMDKLVDEVSQMIDVLKIDGAGTGSQKAF